MAGNKFHGLNVRGLRNAPPRSPSYEGRFGRLFRKLPPAQVEESFLPELAELMRERAAGWDAPGADAKIPAGYTYLGQFIDHDVTFDPTSSLQRANDPDALLNFRSPKFDLDSLYGSGPDDDPFLYDQEAGGLKLLVGSVIGSDDEDDLPRNVQGRALLGDPRNDENIIVSQLHLAFIKAHNQAMDELAGQFIDDEERLIAAQRTVRWRYQWVVVHDYLKRILDEATYQDMVTEKDGRQDFKLKFYKAKKNPYLPVEFSVAAFRFGHSMARPRYDINSVVRDLPLFAEGDPGPLGDFRGFRPLPERWTVDWSLFFDLGGTTQRSRKIDTQLADALFRLPGELGEMSSLAFRNLRRGFQFGLPSGQAVAAHIGAAPLSADDLEIGGREAPLWYYVLKEAEVVHAGERLGPVGSRIVGETLLGLLEADPLSYVNAAGWPPELAQPDEGFGMAQFLQWAVPDQV
jgi:hypothetical protein